MVCPQIGTAVLKGLKYPSQQRALLRGWGTLQWLLPQQCKTSQSCGTGVLTLLELQPRFGDKQLKFQVICPQLSHERDCSARRVDTVLPTYTAGERPPNPRCA